MAGEEPRRIDEAARQNVLLHLDLAGLDARRPLESIAEPATRERERRVREWFRYVFIRV